MLPDMPMPPSFGSQGHNSLLSLFTERAISCKSSQDRVLAAGEAYPGAAWGNRWCPNLLYPVLPLFLAAFNSVKAPCPNQQPIDASCPRLLQVAACFSGQTGSRVAPRRSQQQIERSLTIDHLEGRPAELHYGVDEHFGLAAHAQPLQVLQREACTKSEIAGVA